MKKGNIVDLIAYRNGSDDSETKTESISQELETAIEHLIHRLRKLGPLQRS